MIKRLMMVSLISLLFFGCGIIQDVEEIYNAEDVVLTPVDAEVGVQISNLSGLLINPYSANISNFTFGFDVDVEADNSLNEGNAQIGSVDLLLTPDTAGSASLPSTGDGFRILGGDIDTVSYYAPLSGVSNAHKIGMRYLANRIVNNTVVTIRVTGSYTVEVGSSHITTDTPVEVISFTPNADANTKLILSTALDIGVFD